MFMYIFGVILLGIVVFIHELGHFIFAKLFNVEVTAFSIGFGKPVLKWKKGDTEYRLSIIPLGGYVKMTGETPNDERELTEEEKAVSYSHKKWWQKVTIAFAGPFFNIVLAVFVFFIVSFYEHTAPAPVIEYLAPDGAAAKAGIEEGDTIISIDGSEVHVWEDISLNLNNDSGTCPATNVSVKKYGSEKIVKYTVKPKVGTYQDNFNETQKRCEIGIARLPRDTFIALNSEVEGLQTGDKILSVNGTEVDRFYKLIHSLKNPVSSIKILRNAKEQSVKFDKATDLNSKLIYGGMIIREVEKGSFSEKSGFIKGDTVLSVNGKNTTIPYQFYSELASLKEGDSATVNIIRDTKPETITFKISIEEKDNVFTGMKDRRVKWGAKFNFDYNIPEVLANRADPMLFSVGYSFGKTWEMIEMTFKGFWYLVSGKMSAKSLGGPIMIFDISKRAAEAGMKHFLFILAVISINLGIINLFPVPILDGGHIVMYTFEGVSGKKIPISVKEKILTVGFVLLMMLMAFAIFNDFSRYISIFTGA
jgi:regulator of sigma E protease